MSQIYDISVALGVEAVDYPGDPKFERLPWAEMGKGSACDLSRLAMSAHSGTHLDAPAHFIAGGKTLDQYGAEDFIRPAQVVTIEDPEAIRPAAVQGLSLQPGDAVLFKTRNSLSGLSVCGRYRKNYVYLTGEAAQVLAEKGAGLVGIDYVTVDRAGDEGYPAHHALLGRGLLILEGLNLKEVPPGRYTLICLPLKMRGAEASPARAVLVDEAMV